MTTVTVTNTELRPDGSAKPGGRATVGIVGVGWQGDGSLITDKVHQLTDADGLASFDLAPSPSGTWYVWTSSDGRQSTFIVPSSGGPYTLQELLVTQPSGDPDLAVTQDALAAQLTDYATVDEPVATAGLATKVDKPVGGTATGNVPTVQADGSVAYAPQVAVSQVQKPTIVHPSGTKLMQKSLAVAPRIQQHWLFLSDSDGAGAYANDVDPAPTTDLPIWAQYGWIGGARRMLANHLGIDPGEGIITFGPDEGRWTYAGTTATGSAAGPISTGLQLNSGTQLGTGLALSAAADTVTKNAHGLSNGAVVQPSSLVGGTGITSGGFYYIVNATTNTFQLSTSPGGSAVNITADGTATITVIDGSGATATAVNSGALAFPQATTLDVCGLYSTGLGMARCIVDGVDKTPNLMTATQAALAVGANDWTNRANATLAHSTVGGEDVLTVTAASAGNVAVQTGQKVPVSALQDILISAAAQSPVSSRTWRVGVICEDSSGTQINELTTSDATPSLISSTAWQNKVTKITAPAGTTQCQIIIRADSLAAGEQISFRHVRPTPVTSVVGQAGSTFWRYQITGLSDASHGVVLKAPSTGNAIASWVMARRRTDAGIVVHRVAKSGATSADAYGTAFSSSTQANMLIATFDMLPGPLALFCPAYGLNDIPKQLTNSIPPATYKANQAGLATKAIAHGAAIFYIGQQRYAAEVSGGATQATFYQQLIDLANADANSFYVDVGGEMFIDNATANAIGYMNNAVFGIHLTSAGHGAKTRIVVSVFLRNVPLS